MTEHASLPELYSGARQRLTELVEAHPHATATDVPATPGWRVHDVIAHLTGAAEDVMGGWVPSGGPTEEWTAGHIERGKDVPTGQLLAKWAEVSAGIERILADKPIWPLVMDAGTHEHDVRGAIGNTEARDSDLVKVATGVLLESLEPPAPLLVRTEERQMRVGPESEDGLVTLSTTTFEAFRWRLGRRSRRQLAAMDFSGDPEPYLDHLYIFGPARTDITE